MHTKVDALSLQYQKDEAETFERVKEKNLSREEMAVLRKSYRLPFYLRKEEVMNSVTHMVGGGFGVLGLIAGILCSVFFKPGDLECLFSMIFFGITMIALYSISAIYHGLYVNRGKTVFQVLDHCTIYLLIAGTYTPAVVLGLKAIAPWHYVFLGFILALSILGVVLNATMMRKKVVKAISMVLYIAIGWSIIFFYPVLKESMGMVGLWLVVGGGIAYTVGSILYGIGSKRRYFHSIFHLFVLLGTILQYFGILFFLVIR